MSIKYRARAHQSGRYYYFCLHTTHAGWLPVQGWERALEEGTSGLGFEEQREAPQLNKEGSQLSQEKGRAP